MPGPEGFDYDVRGGEVVITHHGRRATVLRGGAASRFLADVADGDDEQELMARVTGNYRRGNERTAKDHPRNRGR
ncbi:hypothetical protein [Nocardioides hwasunensis]|uniref:DUF2188 domain-containing protein n=1 Tax=Nocardioides hwasunensis TaxID=397258 RepID=A0ABR8MJQ5_9ACTN|nr:hypothetical protein [Nocardioides hwasunensis]MBD3916238.1 hypothetical protein [Nocardioides hwasunensis]